MQFKATSDDQGRVYNAINASNGRKFFRGQRLMIHRYPASGLTRLKVFLERSQGVRERKAVGALSEEGFAWTLRPRQRALPSPESHRAKILSALAAVGVIRDTGFEWQPSQAITTAQHRLAFSAFPSGACGPTSLGQAGPTTPAGEGLKLALRPWCPTPGRATSTPSGQIPPPVRALGACFVRSLSANFHHRRGL